MIIRPYGGERSCTVYRQLFTVQRFSKALFDDWVKGRVDEFIHEAAGGVVAAGEFAGVAGGGSEAEGVGGEVYGGGEFEQAFVDAAHFFAVHVAPVNRQEAGGGVRMFGPAQVAHGG